MTITQTMTDAERIAVQRAVTAAHIRGENHGDYDTVEGTFVQNGRSYFDCGPGGLHFDGVGGIKDWYSILSSLLPDLKIVVTNEYDSVGCCLREMTASGTHSLEFAGVPASGRRLEWEAIALYIFDPEQPDKLIGERAYWDNDALIKQMKGEEVPPMLGLLTSPRIHELSNIVGTERSSAYS